MDEMLNGYQKSLVIIIRYELAFPTQVMNSQRFNRWDLSILIPQARGEVYLSIASLSRMTVISLSLLCVSACGSPPASPGDAGQPHGGSSVRRVQMSDDSMDESLGVSSADIENLSNKMVASILQKVRFAGGRPPVVIVDAKYMKDNTGGSGVSLDLLTTRIRLGLKSHAYDRMVFVAASEGATRLIAEEGILAGNGVRIRSAADYRMVGSVDSHTGGTKSKYMLFTYELIDTLNGEIVWSDRYEFKKVLR